MNEIQELQQELSATLQRAERHRRFLKLSQLVCYGGALVYFILIFVVNGMFSHNASPFVHNYDLNPNPTFWEANKILMFILPLIILVGIGSAGLGFFYKKFTTVEQNSVRRIIRKLFPETNCYLETSEFPASLLRASHFFGETSGGYSLGAIIFNHNGQTLDVRDIVVRETQAKTPISGYVMVLKTLLGGIFGKRVENTASAFRGLLACTELAKTLDGSIVIVPDHLERHLGYFAKTIQSLKNISGNRLMQLENVEFERYFAVYSTDGILARYILTPVMMQKMTELRKKYNRDMMLSFNRNKFFFAVAMPEGFLTLGNNSGAMVNDLYDNIRTVREILTDLRLNNAPEKKIIL